MCGITGAVWTSPAGRIDENTLERMTTALRHRGPDDHGRYVSECQLQHAQGAMPGVALGFRRLSIIDLACSHQPISNEDGSIWLVFNGEIYNYKKLRQRLAGRGHILRTDGDTETLVHLYEDEGTGFLDYLIGMFAIAIWDSRRKQLVLARDRLGKKPLIYRLERDRLLFASELKSLLQVPGIDRRVDPAAIDEYLTYQYVPHPNTILEGFRKLPPGHCAVYRDGQLNVQQYWQPDFNREIERPAEEYAEELRSLMESSVALRLRSDVPLGAFLSGGLDSSITVALMQQLSQQPVKTFSIGFPVSEYDETHFAREVATRIGTEHRELIVEPKALEVLPRLVWHYDEPFGDSSAVPTWYVSQLAREHVTVVLAGDGGDELFAGYDRYKAVALGAQFDRLPDLFKRLVASSLWQRIPSSSREKSRGRRMKRLLESLSLPAAKRYLEWIAIFNESRRADLYTDAFLQRLPNEDPVGFFQAAWNLASRRDDVTRVSLADLVTYLPCDLMTKVDIASMAHGLECREPFLDHRVVELAAAMPVGLKYRRGKGKQILQQTFGKLLPASVTKRKKMGFGVPIGPWFRAELKNLTRETLLGEKARSRGYFRPAAIQQLIDEHQAEKVDHSYRLWALLILELWHQQWIDSPMN